MRYLVLATDYDGTLASEGRVSEATIAALERLRVSGRRAILVTGRRLEDLLGVFPEVELFDYVVAENGALVYAPQTKQTVLLAEPPPREFVERLRQLGVENLAAGAVIIATWQPHHLTVLQAIQEMGLELHIVFNKDAVMVLPSGVNKASGLDYALRKLGLSFHEAVGVGDAENDYSFLHRCECAVAVSNATPSIQRLVARVTRGVAGDGVAELIDDLVGDDLVGLQGSLAQHLVMIGTSLDGQPFTVPPYAMNILVAGPSASGKTTVTAGIVERLIEHAYQVCIFDPEGDYVTLQEVITLGDRRHAPSISEALSVLEDPKVNLNISLLGVPLADRPEYFGQMFTRLRALRTRTGRPHWLVLDEAHHLMPAEWGHIGVALPYQLGETILVTVHPEHLPPTLLSLVDLVIAVGPAPERTLRGFCHATGRELAWPEGLHHSSHQAIAWYPQSEQAMQPMRIVAPRRDRVRHRRKYAEGDMRYHSFYFRGPGNRHNLKAQNLNIFAQIAEGIDEETWLFHLRRGDYSRWFRDAVKDRYLADQAERIERRSNLLPDDARNLIRRLIEARYTLAE
ncbi:MAG: HAD-IIB family hydrolase [Thiogranum sp.]|nr:HAD-IIB family hydrolase [Thiogranum sp.]